MPFFRSMPANDINRLLAGLAEYGLERSEDQSVAAFLAILREHGLLDDLERTSFLKSYHAFRFGTQSAATSIEKAITSLLIEVSKNTEQYPDRLKASQKALKGLDLPTGVALEPTEPVEDVRADTVQESEPEDEDDDQDVESQGRTRSIGLRLAIGILCVWAFAATVATAWLLLKPDDPVLNCTEPARSPLERWRSYAFGAPNDPDAWWGYVASARHNNRSEEILIGLGHLLMISPDNPEVHNSLAWFLCTTDNPDLHDCAKALPYSKHAVDLSSSPHILNTLAEVLFQAGDVDTAIDLELQALQANDEEEHYRRQLERFREQLPTEQ